MPQGGYREGAGRKPYKKSEKLSRRLWTRVTEDEARELEKMAGGPDKLNADWIRNKLLDRT